MSTIARDITRWRKKEIEQLFNAPACFYRAEQFGLRLVPTRDALAKVLIITPRKTGNAPERNRFKRRVKAAFYQEKLYEGGYHWVIFAKKHSLSVSFQEIKDVLLGIVRALS